MTKVRDLLIACVAFHLVCAQNSNTKHGLRRTSDYIQMYGYPSEEHEVRTEDDFFLAIFRIPYSRNNSDADRPVVLLQHGVLLDSDSWVFRGANEDLVFLLSDAGYDVWISNTRGTKYSRHSIYSNDNPKFWDYCITETGRYDLSAIFDYVLNATGKSHLTYIGHSRGNAMLIILLSMKPEYNAKVNLFVSLAPVIYSKQARSLFFRPAATGRLRISSASAVRDVLGRAKVMSLFRTNASQRQMINLLCSSQLPLSNFCISFLFLVNGDDFPMYNKTMMPLLISRFTGGISTKEYVHLLQMRESDKFRQFDYGPNENLKVYGQPEPEDFYVSHVLVPTYIYYGPNDFFVSERDLSKFVMQLPNLKAVYRIPFEKFNHVDYMWAKIANSVLYPDILQRIAEYNGK